MFDFRVSDLHMTFLSRILCSIRYYVFITMKQLSSDTKFAHLGKPGEIFSKGFERRLQKILKVVDLKDKKILDQGTGEGVWMHQFERFTKPENVFGMDVDPESVEKFKILNLKFEKEEQIPEENIKVCFAEDLDFQDNFFDIVFSNEVLEHVNDDQKSVDEAWRVLKPGGKFIIFTPNRGWPFETHGMFLKGKYYWGNIPFLPWMPLFVRRKFSPHVRNYGNSELLKLFEPKSSVVSKQLSDNSKLEAGNWKLITHSHIFSGFDGAVRRWGFVGKLIQKFFFTLEKTPMHYFGISHFLIVEKV